MMMVMMMMMVYVGLSSGSPRPACSSNYGGAAAVELHQWFMAMGLLVAAGVQEQA